MTMEILRGKATDVSKPDENGPMVCNVGEYKIKVHADVERAVAEGEEIVVAGPKDENGLHALAIHNLSTKVIRYVDSTNHILRMGLGGFLGVLGIALSFQYSVGGYTTMATLNAVMAFGGFILLIWALSHVLKIKRAAGLVWFVD